MRYLLSLTFIATVALPLLCCLAASAEQPTYDLVYKFRPNETVRITVTDDVTVETRIKGVSQTAKTYSISTKAWKIKSVSAAGDITLVHSVEDVNMWSKLSLQPMIKYNSRTDTEAPPGYQVVAKSVGIPLVEVTVNRFGRELSRKDLREKKGPVSAVVLPLPEKPVKIGDSWNHPGVLTARLKDGIVKRVKVREHYVLKKVDKGIATISIDTQLLTPVENGEVRVQIMQKIQHGQIEFDLTKGQVLSRKWTADESVVGFNGAESLMKYVRNFEEKLKTDAPVVSEKKQSELK